MEPVANERFVVFIRHDPRQSDRPDHSERLLVACGSYQEARRIQREMQHTYRDCVIRYVGLTGGGD